MTWTNEQQIDNESKDTLLSFLEQYGFSGLKKALQLYINTQQEYICKTRTSISKINISNNELKSLSSYGFIKCAQNRIVSLSKIRTINYTDIILINGIKIHMSKRYALTTITAFSGSKK